MSYPRHQAYRDSGVEWLGNVPAHWNVRKLRTVAQLNPSKSEISDCDPSMPVPFLPMEAVGDDGTIDVGRERPLAELQSGYTYFREGDVTMAKITPCFENGKGARMIGLKPGFGFGSTELTVLRPAPGVLEGRFLDYLLRSPLFRSQGEAHMFGAGGQKRVPDEFVRNFAVPLPALDEQAAIADFLDRELAKLHALIAEQQRMIALLVEKRQTVISNAVTKGINPAALTKPSRVKYLGDIPAHWSVLPLMRLTPDERPIMYGIVLPGPDVDEGVPIVKGGDVAPERLRLELLNRTTHEIESGYERSRLRGGDIVYAIRGSIGAAALVPDELTGANLTQDAARVAPREGVHAPWLLYALHAAGVFGQLDERASGATIRGINIFDLKRVRIPTPPLVEQRAIVEHLDAECATIDDLMREARHAVAIMHEHGAALISTAVTGRIDVRRHADASDARTEVVAA